MPFVTPHHMLGAGLACVALLAGAFGFGLGWFPHSMPRRAASPPVAEFAAPQVVLVTALPAAPP